MNKYIEEHSIQLMQSILILVVSIVIVLGVTVLMIGNVVYMLEQFFYNITNERIGYTDDGPQGIFSYGPYINLRKGSYKIAIHYETDTDTQFDICYKDEDGNLLEMTKGALERDKYSKSVVIVNEQSIDNATFEVRTYYPGTGYLQINDISIRQHFCVDRYILITLAVIVSSMLFLCGKRILGIWERPNEVLCFGCFYTVIACLCLYSMTFLIGGKRYGCIVL